MSGEWLRVMIAFGFSQRHLGHERLGRLLARPAVVEILAREISKRPEALVAAPRPRRRSSGSEALGDRRRCVARIAVGDGRRSGSHGVVFQVGTYRNIIMNT